MRSSADAWAATLGARSFTDVSDGRFTRGVSTTVFGRGTGCGGTGVEAGTGRGATGSRSRTGTGGAG
ncbi:MAG TPA: hypothetical protein VJX92_26185, partial [Methylomirabilota bacterium]|nr:hypothetical protein [Methylomirabilota bacterium]